MWRARLLEILGLWLMVTAFVHHSLDTTMWINIYTGGAVAIIGASLRHSSPWQGLTAGIFGLLLLFTAFLPFFRIHQVNSWVDGVGGFLVWFCGWRIVARESGGPWRLKDRPVY